MRNLVILFLIVSIKSYGQNPINFVDSNGTWNVAYTYPGGDLQHPDFIATVTTVYGFKGDTLISSHVWNKIYATSDSSFASNLTYSGNLREENGFVFFMDTTNSIDTIYNFNLHVGDSIAYHFNSGNNYLFVLNIDSILIDGSYHKRFFFSEPTGPNDFTILNEIWIEEIGSIHGPLFPANPGVFSTEEPDSLLLICYKINDSIIWINPNYNDCYINIVLSAYDFKETQENIFEFPNPVTDELEIQIPQNTHESFSVSIFDMEGRLIKTQRGENDRLCIIDTEKLEHGLYISQVEFVNRSYRLKFAKQ